MLRAIARATFIAALWCGCSSSPAAPDSPSVAGTWDALFEGVVQGAGTTQTDDFQMELTQSGADVAGVLTFGFAALEVPITIGRIAGNTLTYTAVRAEPGCEIRVEAELTVDASGDRLDGSQTQSNCEGTAIGRVTATRQR